MRDRRVPGRLHDQYPPSMLIGEPTHQHLATGFPVGKRFKSAPVVRVADANPLQLGHHARADGRWRMYAFADAAAPGEASALAARAAGFRPRRFAAARTRPPARHRRRLRHQGGLPAAVRRRGPRPVPAAFLPPTGPFGLIDYEKVYAADPERRHRGHLRAARNQPRRRRRRGAPGPVRGERASPDRDRGAGRLLRAGAPQRPVGYGRAAVGSSGMRQRRGPRSRGALALHAQLRSGSYLMIGLRA